MHSEQDNSYIEAHILHDRIRDPNGPNEITATEFNLLLDHHLARREPVTGLNLVGGHEYRRRKPVKIISTPQSFYLTYGGRAQEVSTGDKEPKVAGYELAVFAGRFKATELDDYAIGYIPTGGSTPMQRVNRSGMVDYPQMGQGVCVRYRPESGVVSVYEYNEAGESSLTTIDSQGRKEITRLEGEVAISYQEGDYTIWIGGNEDVCLYNICQGRPFAYQDLTNLDPRDASVPEVFLTTINKHLQPGSYLFSQLNGKA